MGRIVLRSLAPIALSLVALTAAHAQDRVDLRLNLKPGQSYPLHISTKQTTSQEVLDQKEVTTSEAVYDFTWKVADVAPDGTMAVLVSYDRIRLQQGGGLGGQIYDTAQPLGDSPHAKTFGILAGQPFTVRITPDGRILEVTGVDSIVKQMVEAAKPADDEERKVIEDGLMAAWGPDALKVTLQNVIGVYPDKPVAIGDSWWREVFVKTGFPMTLKSVYTLKSVDGGAATIEMTGEIGPAPRDPAPESPVPVHYRFEGKQSGTLSLDLATGWFHQSKLNQELAGTIEYEGGAGAPNMTIPVTVTVENETTGLSPKQGETTE